MYILQEVQEAEVQPIRERRKFQGLSPPWGKESLTSYLELYSIRCSDSSTLLIVIARHYHF